MTRLMIDLPEDLAARLRTKALQGGYVDEQDFVRALINAAAGVPAATNAAPQRVSFNDRCGLENLLLQGIQSGDSGEITAVDWAEKRRSLKQRYAKTDAE